MLERYAYIACMKENDKYDDKTFRLAGTSALKNPWIARVPCPASSPNKQQGNGVRRDKQRLNLCKLKPCCHTEPMSLGACWAKECEHLTVRLFSLGNRDMDSARLGKQAQLYAPLQLHYRQCGNKCGPVQSRQSDSDRSAGSGPDDKPRQ